MLKKINQLTQDKEFNNVFQNGRASYDKIMGIKAIATKLGSSRFGILVSNKISKKAVERNKIKRQIREIIRLQLDKLKPGYDCVIITLPPILDKKYQEIVKSINNNFRKLKLYK